MADVATITPTNEAQKRKPRGRRAPLKDLSVNEISGSKKSKPQKNSKALSGSSFADDLEELQAKLNQLRLEKERAEEMVRERDVLLKKKDEEREKLQKELKKVQKAREFKPNLVRSYSSLFILMIENRDSRPFLTILKRDRSTKQKKKKSNSSFSCFRVFRFCIPSKKKKTRKRK